MPSLWIAALRQFNTDKGAWCIPRKGSEDYDKVKVLMGHMKDAKNKPVKAESAKKAEIVEKHEDMAKKEIAKLEKKKSPKKAATPLPETNFLQEYLVNNKQDKLKDMVEHGHKIREHQISEPTRGRVNREFRKDLVSGEVKVTKYLGIAFDADGGYGIFSLNNKIPKAESPKKAATPKKATGPIITLGDLEERRQEGHSYVKQDIDELLEEAKTLKRGEKFFYIDGLFKDYQNYQMDKYKKIYHETKYLKKDVIKLLKKMKREL